MEKPFYWGTATSAHQIEGAWCDDGKGPNIWDAFAQISGKVRNGDTGSVACDHYHRFEEDVQLMADLGIDAYRFSLAWSRIIPDGKGEPNAKGIAFYNRLIDALLAKGITPFVTLYHWDLPLALQLEHDGWLGQRTVEAFVHYAQTCFDAYGDRVRHWVTFNENWCTAVLGHGTGVFAPGRMDADEPYQVAHYLLLAHGRAVDAFRQGGYAGRIGIANNCDFRFPRTDTPDDRAAAQESLEFFYGWLTDPLVHGDYPTVMRERLGSRLPAFTEAERSLVQGSVDFLGLNHYTTHYASREAPTSGAIDPANGNGGMIADQQVHLSADASWPQTSMGWYVVPEGFRGMLNWIAKRYPGLDIYVTENGCSFEGKGGNDAIADNFRADFLRSYTHALMEARNHDGVPIRGYFCWSLIDNFEWTSGYDLRFGIVHCDYQTLQRTPKKSFAAYREIIEAARFY
ncbi:MAG: GH1 family beta-glucosidase [Opitutales bacterium]